MDETEAKEIEASDHEAEKPDSEDAEVEVRKNPAATFLFEEWALVASVVTTLLFLAFESAWLDDLTNPLWFTFVFLWLFAVMLASAFAIVHHAESLAIILGEPLGTLTLTLAVSGVEVLMISAVMLGATGHPTVARDTMFSVVMALLGGMAGISLLLGGIRHHEQSYNLQGANAYLELIIPLAVICLILPNFTTSTEGPTLSTFQSVFLSVMSIGIYATFLAVQTSRYKGFFIAPDDDENGLDHDEDHETHSTLYHGVMLICYILPLVLLAKQLAIPLAYGTRAMHAPEALSGFIVGILILSPEAMSAVRAAVRNKLQRSINILLGSVLATIALTVPAVLLIALISGKTVHLGLNPINSVLLVLLLGLSVITFSNVRTNALLGAVHLLLFLAFVMLMFES